MTMTKTLMIVAASLIKAKAWTPSGMKDAMGNREEAADCHGFPARTDRAAKNMLENMVLFTALVLVATVGGVADPHVELGARVFYWARIVYIAVYNPMPYEAAREMEVELAIGLREAGYGVWQA